MVDGFSAISDLQRYWKQCEDTFLGSSCREPNAPLKEKITEMYSYILEYQAAAICHLSKFQLKRAWNLAVGSVDWPEKAKKIALQHAACKELMSIGEADELRMRSKADSELLQVISTGVTGISEMLLSIQLRKDETDFKNLLSEGAPSCTSCKDFNPARLKGTCEWFFQDEKFLGWRDTDDFGVFWIYAAPGRGKSVLSKALIDEEHLKNVEITVSSDSVATQIAGNEATVCYFFFKEGNEKRVQATDALCSILHQLFTSEKTRSLIQCGIQEFHDKANQLCTDLGLLWDMLLSCAKHASGDIICVLDALDECSQDSRADLIRFMDQLYQCEPENRPSNLKFFITSRPKGDIIAELQDFVEHATYMAFDADSRAQEISHDINLVIDYEVADLGKKKRLTKKQLEKIGQRFKSMGTMTYLWLHLTMQLIKKRTTSYSRASDIERLLSEIGTSTSDLYERILGEAEDENRTSKILAILLAASRPLTLVEANCALTLALEEEDLPDSHEDLMELLWPQESFDQVLKDMCGLLLHISADGRISFLHLTVREFLLYGRQEGKTWTGRFDDNDTLHATISNVCVDYLALPDMLPQPPSLTSNTRFPLLPYAANYWPLHARESKASQLAREEKILGLLAADSLASSLWKSTYNSQTMGVCYSESQFPSVRKHQRQIDDMLWACTSDLRLASLLGLTAVVQSLVTSPDCSSDDVMSAMYKALEHDRIDIIAMVLKERPDDVNLSVALQGAAEFNRPKIMELLVDHGATLCGSSDLLLNEPYKDEALEILWANCQSEFTNEPRVIDFCIMHWKFESCQLIKALLQKYGSSLGLEWSAMETIVKAEMPCATARQIMDIFFKTNMFKEVDLLCLLYRTEDQDMTALLTSYYENPHNLKLLAAARADEILRLPASHVQELCSKYGAANFFGKLRMILDVTVGESAFAILSAMFEAKLVGLTVTKRLLLLGAGNMRAELFTLFLQNFQGPAMTSQLLRASFFNPGGDRIRALLTADGSVKFTQLDLELIAEKGSFKTFASLLSRSSPERIDFPKLMRCALRNRNHGRPILEHIWTSDVQFETLLPSDLEETAPEAVKFLVQKLGPALPMTSEMVVKLLECETDPKTVLRSYVAQFGCMPSFTARHLYDIRSNSGLGQNLCNLLFSDSAECPAPSERALGRLLEILQAEFLEMPSTGKLLPQLPITEGYLVYLAGTPELLRWGFPYSAARLMSHLLEQFATHIQVTQAVLVAAAENQNEGEDMVSLLLYHVDYKVGNICELVEAALRNLINGGQIMEFLIGVDGASASEATVQQAAFSGCHSSLAALAKVHHIDSCWLRIAAFCKAMDAPGDEEVEKLLDEGLPSGVHILEENAEMVARIIKRGDNNVKKFLSGVLPADGAAALRADACQSFWEDGSSRSLQGTGETSESSMIRVSGSMSDVTESTPSAKAHGNLTELEFDVASTHEDVDAASDLEISAADLTTADTMNLLAIHDCIPMLQYLSIRWPEDMEDKLPQCWWDVSQLLATGCDINRQDDRGDTPLHVAGHRGSMEAAFILLAYEADVDRANHAGDTPLHAAVRGPYADIVATLVDAGADMDLRNANGETAYEVATILGKKEAIRMLERAKREREGLPCINKSITEP